MATQYIDNFFQISARGSSIPVEIRAGLASFLTMGYIVLVNPQTMAAGGIPFDDGLIATAVASAAATFMVGILGNLPIGLCPGLGLSAYFSYGLVDKNFGIDYKVALTSCLIAGVVSLLCSLLKISELIMKWTPECVKMGMVVGMGMLLAFIAVTEIELTEASGKSTLVELGPLQRWQVWASLGGLVIISVLQHHAVPGAILVGIVVVTLVVWSLEHAWPASVFSLPVLQKTFLAFDFDGLNMHVLPGIVAFLSVAIFDVSGCMLGICKLAGLVESNGHIPGGNYVFLSCAIGTIIAACLGCSPIIIALESAAGVKEGGRTGLTAVTIAMCFVVSLFFAPVFGKIPPEATAPVLLLIGASMMGMAARVNWEVMREAIPAYLTIILMPFTFSIPNGIFFGLGFSFVLYLCTGDMFVDAAAWYRGEAATATKDASATDAEAAPFVSGSLTYVEDASAPREEQTPISRRASQIRQRQVLHARMRSDQSLDRLYPTIAVPAKDVEEVYNRADHPVLSTIPEQQVSYTLAERGCPVS